METQRVEDEVASLLDRFHKLHLVRTAALLLFWLKAVPLKRFFRVISISREQSWQHFAPRCRRHHPVQSPIGLPGRRVGNL